MNDLADGPIVWIDSKPVVHRNQSETGGSQLGEHARQFDVGVGQILKRSAQENIEGPVGQIFKTPLASGSASDVGCWFRQPAVA
jgi:hypothetical protein